jgi:uncharacterized MAPEG superfamily protein
MQTFPALPIFVITLIALFAKTSLTTAIQVISRMRIGAFPNPEDSKLMRRPSVTAEAPFVQRCANVWRNDLENLPLFLFLALAYVLLGADAATAKTLFAAYVAMRYLHTVCYLAALQPWRGLAYTASLIICWVLAWKAWLLAWPLLG